MLSPNLTIASDSNAESVEIGFDVASKYYTISKTQSIIRAGDLHLEATKKLVVTIKQAEKLRDDLNSFLGIHEKYK